jgi:hypothetical protein
MLLRIDATGNVTCLHEEAEALDLNLAELGTLDVHRASHVTFDSARQRWAARLVDGTLIGDNFTSKREAVAAEVRYIESRL